MSDNDISYLSYEEAIKLVAAIQEEEDIEENNRRILSVYNYDDKQICWFDFDDIMETVKTSDKKPSKEEVQNYILHHIPDWAKEI